MQARQTPDAKRADAHLAAERSSSRRPEWQTIVTSPVAWQYRRDHAEPGAVLALLNMLWFLYGPPGDAPARAGGCRQADEVREPLVQLGGRVMLLVLGLSAVLQHRRRYSSPSAA